MAIAAVDTSTGEIVGKVTPNKRNKENRDFVMLYRHFIAQIAELGMSDPQALRVLLFLVKHMDARNTLAVPMSLIAEMLQISRQTASAKVKYLQDNGWIAIYKLGKQNVYTVNPDVVWTAYDNEKQYCKFDAKVMLSSVDQWDIPRRDDKRKLKHIDRNVLREMADKEFPDPEEYRQMDISEIPGILPESDS